MTVFQPAGVDRLVHIVDRDHRVRASIAMGLTQSGGHSQIYEDFEELSEASPSGGSILAGRGNGGVAAIVATLHANEIYLPLIIFSEEPRPSEIVRAAHEGAADYLAWPFSGEDLLSSCAYCQQFMEEKGGQQLRRQKARKLVETLSQRERQILALLLDGHSNKSIAIALDLSPRTVEDYRLKAMKKLGVNATSAAVRIGLEAGLEGSWALDSTRQQFNSVELS